MKIFYHPTTKKIMGMSDGDDSMQFPYVETDVKYHSLGNLAVEVKEGKAALKVVKGYMSEVKNT